MVSIALCWSNNVFTPFCGYHLSQERCMMEYTQLFVLFDKTQMIEQIIGQYDLDA